MVLVYVIIIGVVHQQMLQHDLNKNNQGILYIIKIEEGG
jgi:hypothetical protein